MGILDRIGTERLVKGFETTIGSWPEEVRAEVPSLHTQDNAMAVVAHRVLFSSDAQAVSSYMLPNVRRSANVGKLALSQVRSAPGALVCGAPGPGWLTENWALRWQGTEAGAAQVGVPVYRMHDGTLVNPGLFKRTREALAGVLADGPVGVSYEQRPPETALAFRPETAFPTASPLSRDHFLPVPDVFCDGAEVAIPPTEVQGLAAAFDSFDILTDGTALRTIPLAGGRRMSTPRIELRSDIPAVVLSLAPEDPHTRQRTFRAAMATLRMVSELAADLPEASGSAAALAGYVNTCLQDRNDPQRHERFIPAQSEDNPVPVLHLLPGTRVPLGVRALLRTSDTVRILAKYVQATYWLLQRERLSGPQRKRVLAQRGPGRVDNATFRYAHPQAAWSLGRWLNLKTAHNWFWQVTLHTSTAVDGRHEATLFFTGLSRIDDVLCYAQEMVVFLDAFVWLIQALDPEAEFATTYLTV